MIEIVGVCYRFFGDLIQAFGASKSNSMDLDLKPTSELQNVAQLDELAALALTAVFGMDTKGRIKKEKARCVVEKLGLINHDEDGSGFELPGSLEDDELQAEELVVELEEDVSSQADLMRRAFTVFDQDGNGFIEASEVKRVLDCLGLANGLDIEQFEKMVEVADLNFDGKVDFNEFELMMISGKN
ncbi:hypothetical protein NE237_024609 [Protea cynaroides]|uniref:EF-hand domain-containing protein n=1 Tax=Protea cynaroides TaxID=273540 RepID=A0A9Q0K0Y4_9MAGN|nr:hypothetical protein NE237_024609 [Protea cynaroides]